MQTGELRMTREFVELPEFIKCWHDLGLSENDLLE
jgi:hypothetical protein